MSKLPAHLQQLLDDLEFAIEDYIDSEVRRRVEENQGNSFTDGRGLNSDTAHNDYSDFPDDLDLIDDDYEEAEVVKIPQTNFGFDSARTFDLLARYKSKNNQ